MKNTLIAIILLVLFSYEAALAIDKRKYEKDINDLVNTEMKYWSHKDIVINTLLSQNEEHSVLSLSDMKILDSKWHGEKRKNKRPLIRKVLDNELSGYLKKIHEQGEGLYTEIIVIDNMAINAGQSMISANYWQGQQEKWAKTLGSRSYATHISELHFDDNTELFQVEVAFLIIHEEEPIGVIYAGVDVEQLEDWKKRREQ